MDEQRLKKHFQFNDADLFANRNGRLSEKQMERLEADARLERKSARESAGILLGIAAFGFGAGLLIVVNAPVPSAKVLIGLTLCLLWPLAWGWRAWQAWRSVPPARQERVRAAKGGARVLRYEDDFLLEVEGRQFDLEKNPGGVIADGDEVVVFYLERTEEILSLEPLK